MWHQLSMALNSIYFSKFTIGQLLRIKQQIAITGERMQPAVGFCCVRKLMDEHDFFMSICANHCWAYCIFVLLFCYVLFHLPVFENWLIWSLCMHEGREWSELKAALFSVQLVHTDFLLFLFLSIIYSYFVNTHWFPGFIMLSYFCSSLR